MRLAPIALVLLTCFALVTAIPITPAAASKKRADKKYRDTEKRFKKMTKVGGEIVDLQKQINQKKISLDELAEEDAKLRILEIDPPEPQRKHLGRWLNSRVESHAKGEVDEKAAEHSLNKKPEHERDGSDIAKLAKTKAGQVRHNELAANYQEKLVRAPLFFAQRRPTICVSECL
jgi:hypothetical protein